jgi:hypothetical protein
MTGLLACAIVLGGCGVDEAASDDAQVKEPEGKSLSKAAQADGAQAKDAEGESLSKAVQADDSGQATESGIEALQIDGVWVFQYTSDSYGEGLFIGTAEIVDDCLVVDDTIVIWDLSRLADARALVSAVQAGEKPKVQISGGEFPTTEQIRATVFEHCSTTTVWFGNEEEVVIVNQ